VDIGVDIANICPAARARRAGPGLGRRLFAQREHLGSAKALAGSAGSAGSAGLAARAGIRA
jgi:hypothetical protein